MKLIKVCFIDNYFDGVPLSGHAWFEGKYCYFFAKDVDGNDYFLYDLPWEDMIGALATRKLFEDLVGYTASRHYDGRKIVDEFDYNSFHKRTTYFNNKEKLWSFSENNLKDQCLGLFKWDNFQFSEKTTYP